MAESPQIAAQFKIMNAKFNSGPFKTCGPHSKSPKLPPIYKFSSQPKPVEKAKYRNQVPHPRGAHDYYNMMWDPHIFRGISIVPFDQYAGGDGTCGGFSVTDESYKRSSCEPVKPTCGSGGTTAPKPKKRIRRLVGGIPLPVTPPLDGRFHQFIQTDEFLQELDDAVDEQDICTQTDAIYETTIPEMYIPAKFGLDVGTQVEPCELFDFDNEVQPIVGTMSCKILEQALLECMEEEELEALRDQQRAFEELRRQEQLKLQRLREREAKYEEENRRLQCQLEKERLEEEDTGKRICSYLFSVNYLKDMLPQTIEGLIQDGVLQNCGDLFSDFMPWINGMVSEELGYRSVCRDLLDMTIRDVVKQRHKDMYFAVQQEVSESLEDKTDNLVPEGE